MWRNCERGIWNIFFQGTDHGSLNMVGLLEELPTLPISEIIIRDLVRISCFGLLRR